MNQKISTKKILAIVLNLIMMLSVIPMTAFADGTYTFPSLSQSGNNNNTLRYYLTDENAGDVTIKDYQGYIALNLNLDEGWYFEKWDTYFNGYEDLPISIDPEIKGNNPMSDEGHYTFFNVDQYSPFENHSGYRNVTIRIQQSTGFYGDHSVTAVLKPIVTVNAGEGVNYRIATNYPSYTNLAANQVAIKYKDNATITYTIDDKYTVTDVSASYGTDYSDNRTAVTLNSIIKPVTVTINTKLKQHNVLFDANGGKGTMTKQVFEHSVAQTLTDNNYTKIGYTFAGWNTLANGSGISYAEKQLVTFTPANDGDSITLYAQWTKCTNHQWEDGVCSECGTVCSHSGGMATCTEQASCEICSEKYGELAKHDIVYNGSNTTIVETCTAGCNHIATATIERDTSVNTVYTGSAIEALMVSYSNGWRGGNLNITYSDNIDAGKANGSISIGGATASETFEITKATMGDVFAQGYNGIYDGQAHGITINAPADATLSYQAGDGNYSSENPTFKDAGTYTVSYKVSMANYADVKGTAEVKIDRAPLTVMANDHSIKYGEATANGGVIYSGFVSNETEAVLSGTLDFEYTYAKGNNIGTYKITPKGLTSNNYEITFAQGTLTVEKGDASCTVPQSPQTGDNSNLWVLFALLFSSGGALIPLITPERKRKYDV